MTGYEDRMWQRKDRQTRCYVLTFIIRHDVSTTVKECQMLTTTVWWMLIGTIQAELQTFRLKISLASVRKVYRQKLLRYKTTHSSQSVSQSASTVLWTREQSETSCRLLAPLGAFVTTTLILIVRTFIRVELPRSSSDKTDIVSSMRDIINNKYFIRFLAASKMLLNVDWSVPLDHCNYPAQYYTEIIIWLIT